MMSSRKTKQTSSSKARSQPATNTGPSTLKAPGVATTKRGITPFPSGDNAANIPDGLSAAMLRQDNGVENMAKRLKQFNGPWQKMVGAADDDNSLM